MPSLTKTPVDLVIQYNDIMTLCRAFRLQAAGLSPDDRSERVLTITRKFHDLVDDDERAGHVLEATSYLGLSGEIGRIARYLS